MLMLLPKAQGVGLNDKLTSHHIADQIAKNVVAFVKNTATRMVWLLFHIRLLVWLNELVELF